MSVLRHYRFFIAHFLAAWALLVFPLQWSISYWQPLRWKQAMAEDLTHFPSKEENLMHERLRTNAGRRALSDAQPIRVPNAVDDTPVRTPNTFVTAEDGILAEKYRSTYQPLTVQEAVGAAQPANDFAYSIYGTADLANYNLSTDQAVPGNQTGDVNGGKVTVNATEMMPGLTPDGINELTGLGHQLYNDPNTFRPVAEEHDRILKRTTCLQSYFSQLYYQQPDQADDPRHHILKISFYKDISDTVENEGDPELERAVYPGGVVDLRVPAIGGTAGDWLENIGGGYFARYEYAPYTVPDGQDYFAYAHRVRYWTNGGWQNEQASAISSYGSPVDGWMPQVALSIPNETWTIYLQADLYQIRHNEAAMLPNGTCPRDPPVVGGVETCVVGPINFCPGEPGQNVRQMYNLLANPSGTRIGKDFSNYSVNQYGPAITAEMSNAEIIDALLTYMSDGAFGLGNELAGSCNRQVVTEIDIDIDDAWKDEDIFACSETLINPYPDGCETLDRDFRLGGENQTPFVVIKAYERYVTAVEPNRFAIRPIFLSGTVWPPPADLYPSGLRSTPTITGSPVCPPTGCTNDPGAPVCPNEDDPRCSAELDAVVDTFYVYQHQPLAGDAFDVAINGVIAKRKTGAEYPSSFSHYGFPASNWIPTGTITVNPVDEVEELSVVALNHAVTVNTIVGPCVDYFGFVADGFCQDGKLTCLEERNPSTVNGVTFAPGYANEGIVDLLAAWGLDSSAAFPDYDNGESGGPTKTGPGFDLLPGQPMCWVARGEPFSTCTVMGDNETLDDVNRGIPCVPQTGNAQWRGDCGVTEGPNGIPLPDDPQCELIEELNDCDERFESQYISCNPPFCYNPTLAYDCGEEKDVDIEMTYKEEGASCTGEMRCLGTECHRPNLSADNLDDFARAAAGMEALNMMKMSMICAETGAPPTSPGQVCTPVVFGGDPMYCKIPIGNEIGLTPNCCDEAEEAAKHGPNWMDYLKASFILWKISENSIIQNALGSSKLYNSTAEMFGEIAEPITNTFDHMSDFVTEKLVDPLAAGFDNMFGGFGKGGSAAATAAKDVAVDSPAKPGVIGAVKEKFTQMLLKNAHNILESISPGLGQALIPFDPTTQLYKLAGPIAQIIGWINLIMLVYSLLKIIGHIIFACQEEEYEWAMQERWRLCTYAGSCCNQKFLGMCVEKRRLYCCYDSIAARVIAEQIYRKGLLPGRSYNKQKCNIDCSGFTPDDLARVDWEQVDLTEWLDSLFESGLHTPADPGQDYGTAQDTASLTNTVARSDDTDDLIDERSAAPKTAEGVAQNVSAMGEGTAAMKEENHCYDTDERKMPYAYRECRLDPGSTGYENGGYIVPEPINEGPIGPCGTGWTGVPAMTIPTDDEGGSRDLPAFCVTTFMLGDQGGTPVIGTPDTVPIRRNWPEAQSACGAIGGQLIRDSQWLAIAHNLVLMGANWSGGDFGAGSIKAGLSFSQCGEAGPFSLNGCPNSMAQGRERLLTNGALIYDIGGNYAQWTYDDMAGAAGAGLIGTVEEDKIAVPFPSREKGVGAYPEDPGSYWSGAAGTRGGFWWTGDINGPFNLNAANPADNGFALGVRCVK